MLGFSLSTECSALSRCLRPSGLRPTKACGSDGSIDLAMSLITRRQVAFATPSLPPPLLCKLMTLGCLESSAWHPERVQSSRQLSYLAIRILLMQALSLSSLAVYCRSDASISYMFSILNCSPMTETSSTTFRCRQDELLDASTNAPLELTVSDFNALRT